MSQLQRNPPQESGYFTDFENFIHSEIVAAGSPTLLYEDSADCRTIDAFGGTISSVDLEQEANNFLDQPVLSNVFYPRLDGFGMHLFKNKRFKMYTQNSLDYLLDKENMSQVFGIWTTQTSRTTSPDLFQSSSEDEYIRISPDVFVHSSADEEMGNIIEPIVANTENSKRTHDIIVDVEKCIIQLLKDIVSYGNASLFMANCAKWENCEMSNGILALKEPVSLIYRTVTLQRLKSRYHFAMIMYVLSEVYHLLISGTTCSERELYYKDPELAENQLNVKSAVKDVCNLLNVSPWELGIRSSAKGLIAGAIRIHMPNNLVIDCYMYDGATLIPVDMQDITFLETTAKYVLIIEKDTIFEKLLKQNILLNLNSDVILITGRGFPDLTTRLMVKRLCNDFDLPIYMLVDADPFGVEIMFVYRFGSKAMIFNSDQLACPQIRWIGIQPSEIEMLAIPTVAQSKEDNKKVIELLQRSYISADIRNELEILKRLDRKAEIEGIANFSANFLVSDYIPNKIKRNLVI